MPDRESRGFKKQFILPFATLDADRSRKLTRNMEMAAVLYLAESGREKTESHLLKKTDEKIVFLSETWYPLWLVPCGGGMVLFDGFGLVSHAIPYDITPDITIFNEDIRRTQKTTETYTAALFRNADYFRNYRGKEQVTIEGLITAPNLKKDFENYFTYMKEVRKPFTTSVVLTPTIGSLEISTGVKQLSELRRRINKDIENLNDSMKLLNWATARRVKAIREEIKQTQEKYRRDIRKTESATARRILQIQNQYSRKIAKTSRRFNRKLLTLKKIGAKHKKTLGHLKTEVRRCEIKLQSCKSRNKGQAAAEWVLRLERIKKKLPTLRKDIEENNRRNRDVENAHASELAKQKTSCLTRVELVNKILRDLRGSREAEIMMKRQEMVSLKNLTRAITNSMQEMVQGKIASHTEFDRFIGQFGKRSRRLLYMPFYLVRYEKGDKKRYVTFPPSTIGDMGILTKMKGALGTIKVKSLLQSRSEAIAAFLGHLPALFEREPMLEKNVTEAGIRNSILLIKELRIATKKGLKELENETWISKNELQAIGRLLYIYSSSMNRQAKTTLVSENDYVDCLSA